MESTYNPESNPPSALVHGELKEDCVAEWFFAWNAKLTVSPIEAFKLLGVKVSVPDSPTRTVCVAGWEAGVGSKIGTKHRVRGGWLR